VQQLSDFPKFLKINIAVFLVCLFGISPGRCLLPVVEGQPVGTVFWFFALSAPFAHICFWILDLGSINGTDNKARYVVICGF
jgi:hypothetical protein